jgi:hypothetical protein
MAWYSWQDGIAVSSGDFSNGWAPAIPYQPYRSGEPNFFANAEVSLLTADF